MRRDCVGRALQQLKLLRIVLGIGDVFGAMPCRIFSKTRLNAALLLGRAGRSKQDVCDWKPSPRFDRGVDIYSGDGLEANSPYSVKYFY